jgi:mono/diheme cytochrome c family protein
MVADDPEGETYWKVTNGIRMTAMPAFGNILDDKRRWQVTMLLSHADKLTPAARKQLLGPE